MTEAELLAEIERTLRAMLSSVRTLKKRRERGEESYHLTTDNIQRKITLSRKLKELDKLLADNSVWGDGSR